MAKELNRQVVLGLSWTAFVLLIVTGALLLLLPSVWMSAVVQDLPDLNTPVTIKTLLQDLFKSGSCVAMFMATLFCGIASLVFITAAAAYYTDRSAPHPISPSSPASAATAATSVANPFHA